MNKRPHRVRRFVGVDLASKPEGTAACVLEWQAGQARILELYQPVEDDLLVALAEGADLVAIDAPLGWPLPFVEAVSAHAAGEPWTKGPDRDELRYRVTDRVVRKVVGRWPLSVSTDRIGVVAFRAARLHSRLRPESRTRDGSDGVLEVYPAAALHRWDLHHRRYKGPGGRKERSPILDGIAGLVALDLAGHEGELLDSDDRLDALIAALVALAKDLGRVDPLPDDWADAARVEGWIWLPRAGPLS